jgi:hypothetical protein
VRLLAYVTGSVNQELLLQNEYLATENRILRAKLPSRLRLSNPERITLAEIGKPLGRRVLGEVACIAKAKATCCFSPSLGISRRSVAEAMFAVSSSITGAPHELFDHTGVPRRHTWDGIR